MHKVRRRLSVLCAALQSTGGADAAGAGAAVHVNATATGARRTLEQLSVEATLTATLPADPREDERAARTSRMVSTAMFSYVRPVPLRDAKLEVVSDDALALLELDATEVRRREFAQLMTGERCFPGVKSWALNYTGHQFGTFVGQLGDGRAISLGEVATSSGTRWELQLKGAGKTPYSRHSDGRAVLRSSIREFLCSEAMAALSVPTTRALALSSSTETVLRERQETGAIVARLAPTWLRFGCFELAFFRGQLDVLKTMTDYVMQYHMPSLPRHDYGAFFDEVVRRTADMVAHWQSVGFCHGVMNTDNMSILGLTLDYGPFAFMNTFDPSYVCNESDEDGRYSFERQPAMAFWNLVKLSIGLVPLFDDKGQRLVQGLELFKPHFETRYVALMTKKLGLQRPRDDVDRALVQELCELLAKSQLDYTVFFVTLSEQIALVQDATRHHTLIRALCVSGPEMQTAWSSWLTKYQHRLQEDGNHADGRAERMLSVNPRYVLRHHIAQEVIAAAESGDFNVVRELLSVLQMPFKRHAGHESWELPPAADAASCNERCSCSS